MRIGEYIRAYREANRYGVRAMAVPFDIRATTLNRIELGEAIEGKTMLKLINYLFSEENP